ncbi:MAG: glycerate kinase [Roseitalea sp.]|jgi:hydroxypyruvate reductase|nr:glycerate kinase [Roseitalea sp.]MBO6745279.1 glycerate kinase [Roseitalea sp.]
MLRLTEPKEFLSDLYDFAVQAANPSRFMSQHLPEPVKGRTFVVGAGKAAATMAKAFEAAWMAAGHGALEGLVVAPEGVKEVKEHCGRIELLRAAHPVPNKASLDAARRILGIAETLGSDDQMIALLSGGGSALLSLPPPEISFETKRIIHQQLLSSGATISEMNCVRKQFSLIKGGRLAQAAFPAKTVSLILSDIPGDLPHCVASGPTIADESNEIDALRIVERYQLELPEEAINWLKVPQSKTPSPFDAELSAARHTIVGSAQCSLEAAAKHARSKGLAAHILSDCIQGEAREAGKVHGGIVRQMINYNQPLPVPSILLSGGETTVTVTGDGRGGRNAEFALGFAIEIAGLKDVHGLVADTDGIDGMGSNAGVFCSGSTVSQLRSKKIDPYRALANNDALTPFEAIGALHVTGPTGTNVNDFRAIAVGFETDLPAYRDSEKLAQSKLDIE